MANEFLKAEKIVSQGLGLLQRELLLPRLVTRKGAADFVGAKDDTITIRIPSLLKGREKTWRSNGAITVDDLNEFSVPVTLDTHVYNAVRISDEELTLDISDWGEQVARPQTRAVAERLESKVATVMAAANTKYTVDWAASEEPTEDDMSFRRTLTRCRKHLNSENVPADGRVVVLGCDAEEAALNSPHLNKVDQAGTDSVLTEAVLGKVAGFTIIGNCNSVPADFAMAFHPTAFSLGNVAPAVPEGATAGATLVFDGLAMRWVKDYDATTLADRSVYSAFAGASSVEDGRVMDVDDPDFGELTNENVRAVEIAFALGS